ncbi:MAG: hypothetical protein JWM99_1839 [Verrucomicrobiales bacterium]|nr:hypothetical protein [Verrucomicrobiales bacterium]
MKCDAIESLLIDSVDGELPAAQMELLSEHLNDCPNCREFSADQHVLDRLLFSALKEVKAPAHIRDSLLLFIDQEAQTDRANKSAEMALAEQEYQQRRRKLKLATMMQLQYWIDCISWIVGLSAFGFALLAILKFPSAFGWNVELPGDPRIWTATIAALFCIGVALLATRICRLGPL